MRRFRRNSTNLRRRFFAVVIVGGLVLSSICLGYSGGSGTAEEPYRIANKADLLELGGAIADYNKCFILTADINMAGQEFTTAIIAVDSSIYSGFQGTAFSGAFDGNDHKIMNFTINGGSDYYHGLFGKIDDGGAVKNLNLENCMVSGSYFTGGLVGYNTGSITDCCSMGSVYGSSDVGGLVGRNEGGDISNCYSAGDVNGLNGYCVGGLVGWNEGGDISNCCSTGNVSGLYSRDRVGGLVGHNINGSITNCYSTGNVFGSNYDTGGLAGTNAGISNINNCYSTGSVNVAPNSHYVGGLVGENSGSISNSYSTGTIISDYNSQDIGGLVGCSYGGINNCYSTGSVMGSQSVGGLVGRDSGSVINCYSTGTVSGTSDVGGLVGENYYDGSISDCYSIGAVNGDFNVGGLVGYNNGDIVSSFWDMETSGQMTSAGGEGKTTAQMQDINTFLSAGWDFINEIANGTCNYWQMPQDAYPVLSTFYGYIPPLLSGSGTAQDPYIVTDANDLGTVWYRPLAYYILTNDINLAGIQWSVAVVPAFSGVLNGNGFTINNLSINGGGFLGLFGIDNSYSQIKNLGLEDYNISGSTYVGGLAAGNRGVIINCYSKGNISGTYSVGGLVGWNTLNISNCYSTGNVGGSSNVGGMVGYNSYGSIIDCCSTSDVNGHIFVGGLVGENDGSIINCYSTGIVSGDYQDIGGLVGQNYYLSSISNCYSKGNIIGTWRVGGLVGENFGSINNCCSTGTVSGSLDVGGLVGNNNYGSSISNCYSTGDVNGNNCVGGLVGENTRSISNCYSTGNVGGSSNVGGMVGNNYHGTVNNSFWDKQTSGRTTSAGGTGKTTAEMQTESTFMDAGWDFVGEVINGPNDIWKICEGMNYPKLSWQIPLSGDFVCPDGVDFYDFAVLADQWLLEKLPADVAPGTGDGIVNFIDYAVFAYGWPIVNDTNDLADFASQWLKPSAYCADIAPAPGGDSVVDMLDLAAFANNWLEVD
jgi:hypothetical protein